MGLVLIFLLFYLWHSVSITLVWHRKLSHRSFQCPKWIEYLGVAGGYLAFQGSVVGWCVSHRIHHMGVDTDLDPHTPRKGVWYAFMGWLFNRKLTRKDLEKYAPDLVNDPVYRFLGIETFPDKPLMNLVVALSWRALLWLLFGWEVAAASLLAGLIAFLAPQLINTVCHLPQFGYRNHNTNDDSRNVPWLFIAMGEQYHNNHHRYPKKATQSHKPGELDPTYWVLLGLERLGLAWDIKR